MRQAIGPIALIFQLGAIILVANLLPLAAGLVLDHLFRTSPWITLITLMIGVVAAITLVYRVVSTQYKKLS